RPRKPRSASMLRIGRAAIRGNTALAHAYDYELEAEPELIENIIPIGQRRTILELNEQTCRWPVGDPGSTDFFFCGGNTIAGLPSPIAPVTRGLPISPPPSGGATAGRCGKLFSLPAKSSGCFAEAVVERIAGAAHSADRVGIVTAIERLAQSSDMHIDRALVA